MYKNGSGINIDKVSEIKDANIKTGLEVSVSVSCREYELRDAISTLCLFDKLYIEYIETNNQSSYGWNSVKEYVAEFNKRTISRFDNFVICSILGTSDKWLKVGNVIYKNQERDWEDLVTNSGIIVDLPLGEVDITPNREELQFTSRTKSTIKECIKKVKTELQSIANEIQSQQYTLPAFYKNATTFFVTYRKGDIDLLIDKHDVTLDFSKSTIEGKPIPAKFDSFLLDITHLVIDKDTIYKVFNDKGILSHYRKISKSNARLSSILEGSAYLGIKIDKVIKSVTAEWYREEVEDSCAIVLFDKAPLEDKIRKYSDITGVDLDNCISFLFSLIPYKPLSNSIVPKEFIDKYKRENKREKKTANTSDIPIRLYDGVDSYRMDYLKNLQEKGTVVYSQHTTEDSFIRSLAALFNYINNIVFITVKKDYLSLFENNRRFISLEDFTEFPNTIIKKFVTAKIIQQNMQALGEGFLFGGVIPRSLPIVMEFRRKYNSYYQGPSASANADVTALLKKYQDNGWYYKADIEYFKVNKEDLEALKTMYALQESKTEIAKCIAFLMFGKRDKIGLTVPKINICKYLRQFKYECN